MFPYPTRGFYLLCYSIWLRYTQPNHNLESLYAGYNNPNDESIHVQKIIRAFSLAKYKYT